MANFKNRLTTQNTENTVNGEITGAPDAWLQSVFCSDFVAHVAVNALRTVQYIFLCAPCSCWSAYPAASPLRTLRCVPCGLWSAYPAVFSLRTLRCVPCGFWSAYPAASPLRTLRTLRCVPCSFLFSVPCSAYPATFPLRTLQFLPCSAVLTNFETYLVDLPSLLNLTLYNNQPSPTSHPRRQMGISRVRVCYPAIIHYLTTSPGQG
jgi:hypothetical protein